MRLFCLASCVAFVALSPLKARAHLGLDAPVSRYGPDVLKTGPCGVTNGERTNKVTYYEPGATIEVRWNEYVDHPGHYRIAFDDDGVDDFVDPATMMEFYSNDTVLLDDISDGEPSQRDFVATVTLPDITCDNCTLQVIQVMYDKPPYELGGNDIYYQCADLILREGGAPPDAGVGADAGIDAGTESTASGCAAATGRHPMLGVMSLLLLLFACRLARRHGFPV
jgi:hypothetical protein